MLGYPGGLGGQLGERKRLPAARFADAGCRRSFAAKLRSGYGRTGGERFGWQRQQIIRSLVCIGALDRSLPRRRVGAARAARAAWPVGTVGAVG